MSRARDRRCGRSFPIRAAVLVFAGVGLADALPLAVADDPATRSTRGVPQIAVPEIAEVANSQTLVAGGRPAVPVDVLKWGNQVREEQTGIVRAWIDDGRVVAVSTLFSSRIEPTKLRHTQEWTALSATPLESRRGDQVLWRPEATGPKFTPVPDAPRPEGTRIARGRQLRDLARRFTGASESPYKVGERWELRLLPRPLYRYGDGGGAVAKAEGDGPVSSSVLDGAFFSLVSNAGTDPEILVLIEARRSGSEWRYEYLAARFSDHSLTLSCDGKPVWEFRNPNPDPYFRAGLTDTYRLFVDREFPVEAPAKSRSKE